jgi:O-antigen ligase
LFAILFVALISIALVTPVNGGTEIEPLIVKTITIFLCLQFCLYFCSFIVAEPLGINLFNNPEHYRFTGFAENPNQLALYLAISPFVCIAWYKSSGKRDKCLPLLFIVFIIVLGISTRSDALMVAWIVGLLTLLLFFAVRTTLTRGSGQVVLALFAFAAVAILILAYEFTDIYNSVVVVSQNVYETENNQGSHRVILGINGLKAWSLSPLIGLGPGSFSGFEARLQNMEVHNTPLDWATQTGIVGLLSMVSLVIFSLYNAWRSRRIELVAGMVTLIAFSQFHFVLRQPIVWVFVVWLLLSTPITTKRKQIPVRLGSSKNPPAL